MVGSKAQVTVLGAGSWGTALAILLARNGHTTLLWGRDPDRVSEMARARCNRRYLPEHPFPDSLGVTSDLAAAAGAARDLFVVVPSRAYRETLRRVAPHLRAGARTASATKGIEAGSGRLLHAVQRELLGPRVPHAVISGPTFAGEVAAGLPAAVTVASEHADCAEEIAGLLHGGRLRVYTSDDVAGVEVGGTVKNVLAIAAGIADGLGFGANTRAALIARGLQEMVRLSTVLGGRHETIMGLSGLGDLVLTCTDDQSRNRRMGLALAGGLSVAGAERSVGQVVEGIGTTREVMRIAHRHQVELPICEQVDAVLGGVVSPLEAVNRLLARAAGPEVRP